MDPLKFGPAKHSLQRKETRLTRTPQPQPFPRRLDPFRLDRLRTLLALADLEFDLVAFLEGTKAFALNLRIVHEDVIAVLAGDKPIPLRFVEPLHGSDSH